MPFKNVESKCEEQMKRTIEKMREELATVRTGRANPAVLDAVRVESYGAQMPINQLATIGIPEARTIEIRPWDVNTLKDIEKAILKSQLGLTPNNDGKIIRINLPALTEQSRLDLVKYVKQIEEQHKVSVRNARRDAINELKVLETEKKITEDAKFITEEGLQKLTDKYIHLIDDMFKHKEKEIMEV
jgi:ribosome recycling factor